MKRHSILCLLLMVTSITIFAQQGNPSTTDDQPIPLITHWVWGQEDNYTVTPFIEQELNALGGDYQRGKDYTYSEPEGFLLSEAQAQELNMQGVKALKLYLSKTRKDYLTLMENNRLEQEIGQDEKGGYELIGILGYVFTEKRPGTKPLKQFWNWNRRDYHLSALELGQTYALNAEYELVRIEGYISAEPPVVDNLAVTNPGGYELVAPGAPREIRTVQYQLPGSTGLSEITVEIVNGLAVYEGDMVLYKVGSAKDPDVLISNDASLISDDGDYCWQNGKLYYQMPPNHPKKDEILQAIEILNNETNLDIQPKTADITDYIFVGGDPNGGCWSALGKSGGMQEMNIGQYCSLGSIMHEFIHAAGFFHEQSRPDRDQFVQIIAENIEEGKEHNFDLVPFATSVSSYDYGSIMHYGVYAFSNRKDANGNPLPTIQPTQPLPADTRIGQRAGLSSKDIVGINARYGGPDSNCGGPSCQNLRFKQMPDGKFWLTQNLDCEVPGSYCYENNSDNCVDYGRLYTYEAAQEGCAQLGEGWHLPSIEEWENLADSYGGLSNKDNVGAGGDAYNALIAGGSSGFNALLGGAWLTRFDNQEKSFLRLDSHGFYWSSTEGSESARQQDAAFYVHLIKPIGDANRYAEEKVQAFSVRCVKD